MNNERYNQIIDEAYENYKKHIETQQDIQKEEVKRLRSQGKLVKVGRINLLSREEFINKCKTDIEFSERWGLKIEERELNWEERGQWCQDFLDWDLVVGNLDHDHIREDVEENAPAKLTTITYKDETIEIYE